VEQRYIKGAASGRAELEAQFKGAVKWVEKLIFEIKKYLLHSKIF
jgi:hypothetical protein